VWNRQLDGAARQGWHATRHQWRGEKAVLPDRSIVMRLVGPAFALFSVTLMLWTAYLATTSVPPALASLRCRLDRVRRV
jgi:hypothetical protein